MNICFYAAGPKSGLDNNGGTRTNLKSAEVLRNLGHEVSVVATYDKFTWFPHPAPVAHVPKDADVIVAVTCNDIKNALKHGKPVVYWCRGVELWKMPEAKIIQRASMCDRVICNAQHLVDWMHKNYVDAELCYAGMDLDFWKDYGNHQKGVVGGLINYRHKTKRSDIVEQLATKTAGGFYTEQQMRGLYNECAIWLSPSENEGFHQCPCEAALCGCLVIGNRGSCGGTRDWLDNTTGHLFSTVEEARKAIEYPDYSLVENAKMIIKHKIGSRDKNMERFVKLCQSLL